MQCDPTAKVELADWGEEYRPNAKAIALDTDKKGTVVLTVPENVSPWEPAK
jgi:hypothetical protein